jgi:hypothetical protein
MLVFKSQYAAWTPTFSSLGYGIIDLENIKQNYFDQQQLLGLLISSMFVISLKRC